MKKIVSLFLGALLVTTIFSTALSAADSPAAKIGDTEYTSLEDAVEDVGEGGTIELLGDVALSSGLAIDQDKNFTLDLGGHTLSHSGGSVLDIYGDVIIQNGRVEMTGAENSAAIWLNKDAQVTIAGNASVAATDSVGNTTSFAIAYWQGCNGASLTVAGSITGEEGITVNGTITDANTLTIEDGASINVSGTGLYLAGMADTTVGAAEVSGTTGIEIRAGSLVLGNGAEIEGTGAFSEQANSNGTTVTGAAVAVSQHTTNQEITVRVEDGAALTGSKALYETDLQDSTTDGIQMNVQGGTFTGEITSENVTGFVAGGVFDQQVGNSYLDPSVASASITSNGSATYYVGASEALAETLVANANSGDTIAIQQGNLALDNLAENITVENNGAGTVTVDGTAVPEGGLITQPSEPDQPSQPEDEDNDTDRDHSDSDDNDEWIIRPNTSNSSSETEDDKGNPSMGGNSFADLAMALAVLSLVAGGTVVRRKRK